MVTNIKQLIILAQQNNPEALNKLGFLYDSGKQVKQDYIKAKTYYLKAAALGFALAHFNLGILYERGLGVDIDMEKAIFLAFTE